MYNCRATAVICFLIVVWTNDVQATKKPKTITSPVTTPPPPTSPRFDNSARDVADGSQNGGDSTLTRMLGSEVKAKPYDPMFYDGSSGGPVKGGDDLECKTGQICCWTNSGKHTATTLKWQTGQGPTDPAKMQSTFNTQKSPDEHFLVAYSDNQRGPNERALFESCSIGCADGNIDIQFRYWVSPGIILRVCTRDAFFGDTDELANCRTIQTSKQSGLAKASVPGGQLITLDIAAGSFASDTGSIAIVDRINVSFKACPLGGPNPTPRAHSATQPPHTSPVTQSGGSPASVNVQNDDQATNCPALRCNFDQDTLCGYTEYRLVRSSAVMPTKGFAIRHGRFENLLTGTSEPKDHGAYAAAYLYPGDSASLQSEIVKITESRILHFNGYFAAQGLRLKACLDSDSNCPLITSTDVKLSDRKRWRSFNVILPRGTKQVFIIAENIGQNQGAVGLDNVELLRPISGGPVDAEQSEGSACDGGDRARN